MEKMTPMENMENMDPYGDCRDVPLSVIANINQLERYMHQSFQRLDTIEEEISASNCESPVKSIKDDATVSPGGISYVFMDAMAAQQRFLVFQIGEAENLERFMLNCNCIQCVSKIREYGGLYITLQIGLKSNDHILSCLASGTVLDESKALLLKFSMKSNAGQQLSRIFFE
ncbi:hypothetical protein [Okeania sp. SIO1I7]|uniref:hypothetical protein n=1 Tax=Okeania sp. SIO1I7 TaxID=2607772 RepID=UPI0013F7AE03|nr:hypothetical protein [Okeania sp. SIO1I7]NET29514.1 hypothetical protein [Okeania sp. SIO1I7]